MHFYGQQGSERAHTRMHTHTHIYIYIHIYVYVYADPRGGRLPAGIADSNPSEGMSVCCECCVLSGRGLCIGLITRPEKSYRVWCV